MLVQRQKKFYCNVSTLVQIKQKLVFYKLKLREGGGFYFLYAHIFVKVFFNTKFNSSLSWFYIFNIMYINHFMWHI